MRDVTRKALEEVIGPPGKGWCIDFHWRPVAHDRLVNRKGKALTQPHGGTWGQDAVECVGITIRSFALFGDVGEPDPIAESAAMKAVTTSIIRRVNWAQEIDQEKRRKMAPFLEEFAKANATADTPVFQRIAAQLNQQARNMRGLWAASGGSGRKRRYDAEHFALVAQIYDAERRLGNGSSPTKAVAQAFDRPRSTANKWVTEARELGLIKTDKPKGRPIKKGVT